METSAAVRLLPPVGMGEQVRAHVLISGMVQGVFFRHETAQRARTRGLGGWVRNLADGGVEAVFEGSRAAVESIVRWCHEGPRFANVDSVEVSWEEPTGERDFGIR